MDIARYLIASGQIGNFKTTWLTLENNNKKIQKKTIADFIGTKS